MKNQVKVFVGSNVYTDFNDNCAEKPLYNVGEVFNVCESLNTNTNKTSYDFATCVIGEGENENNQVSRNLGGYRIVKIKGEYAVAEKV